MKSNTNQVKRSTERLQKALIVLQRLEFLSRKRITIKSKHSDHYDDLIYFSREILDTLTNDKKWMDLLE